MVFDCFMFFNELDLLEIRLHELDPVVDWFVIVESLETHGSTNKKPAYIGDNWHIVKPFENKVRYVLLDNLEPPFTDGSKSWPRENFHRNSLMKPIMEAASDNDIIMISDCDEIPRASTLKQYFNSMKDGSLRALNQDFFYYNVNNHLGKWNGTVLGSLAEIKRAGGLQNAREHRDCVTWLNDGGWHFSYFGGLDRIKTKVENFAHASDFICQEFKARPDEEIISDIKNRNDLYHRPGEGRNKDHWQTNDPRLPKYFLENIDRFSSFVEK